MIFLISGIALLLLVIRDVFQTVLVPRGMMTRFHIAPFLVRGILWPPFRWAASKITSPVWKAELLALFAPFLLMTILTIWMSLLVSAFGLIAFAEAKDYSPPLESPMAAFYVSGSSVLTLGSAEYVNKTTRVRLLMLAGAFTGMVLTASVVSLLFALLGSLQRREVLVSLTSNIAGSPPSGITILETYGANSGRNSLNSFYEDWHRWCADVFDTHKAYPILPYFRSNDAYTSWLTALGATLDSVSLLLSVQPEVDCLAARLMYKFGCKLVKEFALNWNLEMAQSPEINQDEFHGLYARLQAANYCVNNEVTARQNYLLLRREYLPAFLALCAHIAVPLTPVTSEYKLQLPALVTSE